jgi:hypothetical protein
MRSKSDDRPYHNVYTLVAMLYYYGLRDLGLPSAFVNTLVFVNLKDVGCPTLQ